MSVPTRHRDPWLQQVLDAADVGYWEWRRDGDRLRVDDRLAGWLGARPTTMVAYRALTLEWQRRDGRAVWYRAGARWIEERRRIVEDRRLVGACLDITDRRRREAALVWAADHDPLTGLPARRSFDRLLEQVVRTAHDPGTATSLLMVDLDGFKAVNDRLGHVAGDGVLAVVGRRLQAAVRRSDPVARWGGDEFAVLVESDVRGLRAGGFGQRLLIAIQKPIPLLAGTSRVRASIGIAVRHPDEAPASLTGRADRALYAAKAAGGDRWCLDGWAP